MSQAERRWNATRELLRGRRGEPPLRRLATDEPAPASYAQEGLWLLDRMRPGDSAYNLTVALRLRGALDVRALDLCLTRIVRRHTILRSIFEMGDARLEQRVGAAPDTVLRRSELAEDALPDWIAGRAGAPFDLRRGPLFRADLARLSADDHCLLIRSHHTVLDAWSFEILMGELCDGYARLLEGTPAAEEPPRCQYRDFAAWERARMTGELVDGLIAYWRDALPSEIPVLALPSDKPRRTGPSGRGGSQSTLYPRALTDALKALARREGTTLYTVLLAAFKVLLYRYTGETDLVVGSPIATRTRPKLADMLGMLINTLPLRTRLGGAATFRELLPGVAETVSGALAHQDLPFEVLVRALGRHRYAGSPLFQVMFAFQNVPRYHWRFVGLACDAWNVEPPSAKFDLTLTLQERDDGLSALFSYDADRFGVTAIAHMMEHFGRLLEGIVADPDRAIGQLALASPSERAELIALGKGPPSAVRGTLHRLFEAQVRRSPDATALVSSQGQRTTYGELNQQANRLARHLRNLGVRPGARVGVCLARSPELVRAQLAILKVGAAYVPIADLPPQRMARIGRALGFVVTDSGHAQTLTSFVGPVVDIHDDRIDGPSIANLDFDGTPESLAYVMFSSGSAGEPRGVAVPHRGVTRLVVGASYARLASDEVFLQWSPVTSDASTFEVWGALLNGAVLVLAPAGPLTVSELGATITRHQVTTLWLTAGLFDGVVESGLSSLASLRQLLTGRDVVSVEHARRFRARWPHCRLIDCYGPTENTTFSTSYEVGVLDGHSSVPIGRPMAGTSIYLLDPHLQPVPRGVVGEAYLGGEGVACGYLDDAEATRERFVPSPFVAGDVLYRTGDRMRWRDDGELEFVGRSDEQRTIRGLQVGVEAPSLTEREKRALPSTARATADSDRIVVPRDEVERLVARAFGQILMQGPVGIFDSFFDIGGDSFSANRLRGVLERQLKRELPLSMLYQNPSVAELARALSTAPSFSPQSEPGVMTLKSGRARRPLFLVAGGRGGKPELTLCAKLVTRLAPEEVVYGVLASPAASSVETAARLHLATIRRLQPAGPYRLGGECTGGVVAYEIAQQLLALGERVELLLLLDTFCPSGVGEMPRMPWRQRLAPKRLLRKSRELLRAGAAFLAELPKREPGAVAWPIELWRRVALPDEAKRHIEACMRYRPSSYPGRAVILASADSLRCGLAAPWQALVRGGVVVRQAPGDHESYSREYFRESSDALRRCLEQEQARAAHAG